MKEKSVITLKLFFILVLFILTTVYLFDKRGNYIFRNPAVEILTTDLDKETRYNDLAISILEKELRREGFTLSSVDNKYIKPKYTYKSQLKSLQDNENTILKWTDMDIKTIVKSIRKVDNRDIVVLTTNSKLDIPIKEVLSNKTKLKKDILYVIYDVDNLKPFISLFDDIDVVIPIYMYNAFYFANINYVYTNNLAKIISNSINNIDEKVIGKIYFIEKDPYNSLRSLKEMILY